MDLSLALLHEKMADKQGNIVTTSLTLIDLHDMARTAATYGVHTLFVAHPSVTLRKLARALQLHWEEGFGAGYNPNRKEALSHVDIVTSLDEAIHKIELRTHKLPRLVGTSAREGGERMSYTEFRELIKGSSDPYMLLFGTGWGMSQELLDRTDIFLQPIKGPVSYNHLSVRSACAIILDRLCGA